MHLRGLEISGFKSFAKKTDLEFSSSITAIVGPNGSGKSNVAEAFRFSLGEQSMKTLRGKKGEDLIWNGSNAVPRAGRASVSITFDNRTRFLNADFDEVVVERIVHRDGANEYKLNGSAVRLRDVSELLSGANIGASGHHIISQGEADRILSANPKERREMVEDGLGLRTYQFKKRESARKLEKTEENKRQVQALRKENAPHLKFLAKQMERLQKAEELRDALRDKYLEYLRREDLYITFETERIAAARAPIVQRGQALELELAAVKDSLEHAEKADTKRDAALAFERELSDLRRMRDELSRESGRLEGKIRALEESRRGGTTETGATIALHTATSFAKEVGAALDTIFQSTDLTDVKRAAHSLRGRVEAFLAAHDVTKAPLPADDGGIASLTVELKALEDKLADISRTEREQSEHAERLRWELDQSREQGRKAEREMYRIIGEQGEVKRQLSELTLQEQTLAHTRDEFKREVSEGMVLIGRSISEYKSFKLGGGATTAQEALEEGRPAQEARRRDLEKMKIRLEEFGAGGGEEVAKEYQAAKERDEYLEKEIADLEHGAAQLVQLIAELSEKLDREFREGVAKISVEFNRFFGLMFGNGSAELKLVAPPKKKKRDALSALVGGDDEESAEPEEGESDEREGVEVAITLPHKRIKGLEMLSGGERALTSIALVFAMSQVNPPPFLILDETDAALDEANSRRYGDMIENLAKRSQLILITHNRETMSRASVLYGVTMGADGVSKLLSVKFEEAVKVAK